MYLSKNNLYSNNHYWCQINVLSHYPLNVNEQSMSFTHHDLYQHTASEGQHNQVFTCQHEVLFLLQVKHSVNTSGFSLIRNYSTVGWDVIHVILKRIFFFLKTIKWIHRSPLKWNTTKTFPRSYCLAVAFLWTETSLHSETFKFINVGQPPHVIRTNEFPLTFKGRTSFCYYSRNPDPRLYLYMKIWAGTRQFFTNPIHFLEVYWTKDCLYLAM